MGSGGIDDGSEGGGVIRIIAGNVTNSGEITTRSSLTGAGGSISYYYSNKKVYFLSLFVNMD